MKKYRLAKPIGAGTFSEVLKAQNIKTGEMVAIKAMRHPVESLEKVRGARLGTSGQ
jgi:renal tumor antigen